MKGSPTAEQYAAIVAPGRAATRRHAGHIPAAGHNIALENPAALAQAYLDFFAG